MAGVVVSVGVGGVACIPDFVHLGIRQPRPPDGDVYVDDYDEFYVYVRNTSTQNIAADLTARIWHTAHK